MNWSASKLKSSIGIQDSRSQNTESFGWRPSEIIFRSKSVYDYEDSKGPGEEDRVLEWSEFQPGLWIPKKIEIVVNDWDADQGAMVPMLRTDLHVNKIDLKPDYPLTFFQEIKLPEVK